MSAVEGTIDEAVLRRLVQRTGAQLSAVHGKNGKAHLLQRLAGYNNAAWHSPWIVLIDLDGDAPCAAAARSQWLPDVAPLMCFRIAVQEVEAWLLADRERIAHFLSVSTGRIPSDPDSEHDPKQLLVQIAGHSRRRVMREDMVPRPGSGRAVGPAYPSRVIEFVGQYWSPDDAASQSDSLRRCLVCLDALVAGQTAPALP